MPLRVPDTEEAMLFLEQFAKMVNTPLEELDILFLYADKEAIMAISNMKNEDKLIMTSTYFEHLDLFDE